MNRFAAQSAKRMHKLIAIADSTEVNALVIDVKDEFGLNIPSQDPLLQKNAGKAGVIPNVKQLLDTLKAHDILAVARIVVFKDSVAARANPDHVIRKPDGTPWHDKQGLTWVNQYDEEIWEYDMRVAEEAVRGVRRRRGEVACWRVMWVRALSSVHSICAEPARE